MMGIFIRVCKGYNMSERTRPPPNSIYAPDDGEPARNNRDWMTDPHKSRTVHAGGVLLFMAASIAGVWWIKQHEVGEKNSFATAYQAAVQKSRNNNSLPSTAISGRFDDVDRRLDDLDEKMKDVNSELKALLAAPERPPGTTARRHQNALEKK
jgi:hypothetical protein